MSNICWECGEGLPTLRTPGYWVKDAEAWVRHPDPPACKEGAGWWERHEDGSATCLMCLAFA